MKKYFRIFVVTLAALFVFAACDSSGGSGPVDNPQSGEMTAETAKKIFDYDEVSGGVEIKQFWNKENALAAYIGGGSKSPAHGPARAPAAPGTLVLNKIAGMFIVSIAENAFNPSANGGNKLSDSGITQFRLPEKLKDLKENSFKDAGLARLLVPETVTALPETIVAAAENAGAQVAASNGDKPFLGEGVFITDGKLCINVPIYDENGAQPFAGSDDVVVTDVIDNDESLFTVDDAIQGGRFRITVPVPAKTYKDLGWPNVELSGNVEIFWLGFVGSKVQDSFFPVLEEPPRAYRVFVYYATGSGTMKGQHDDGEKVNKFDVDLRKGWNVMIQDDEFNVYDGFADNSFTWRHPGPEDIW